MHTPVSHRIAFALAVAAAPVAAFASQPPARAVDGEVSIRYSGTSSEDLTGAPAAGEASVSSIQVSARGSAKIAEQTRLNFGLEWVRHDLDLSTPAWLPGELSSLALPLGVTQTLDESWRLSLQAQPRLASTSDSLDGDGFDVPVMALASYTQNPELTWSFGVRYSDHGDYKVMPIVGLSWKFAPDWEARVAFPETALIYRVNKALSLRAVAGVHGGSFRVSDDASAPSTPAGASLRKAWLEYREIRTGVAASLALSPMFSVRADVGAAFGRRFEYIDRGLTLKGGTPLYGTLAVSARF